MTIKPYVIGIDPGITGAFAIYDNSNKNLITAAKIPTIKNQTDEKKHIEPYFLADQLRMYASKTLFAVVEDPGAMPNQGVTSMFRFGHACGMAQGILAALGVKIHLVKPAVWKMLTGLSYNKEQSLEFARHFWPMKAHLFAKRNSDGMAEAALLAKFGAERLWDLYAQ